jgi:hypothetical protein
MKDTYDFENIYVLGADQPFCLSPLGDMEDAISKLEVTVDVEDLKQSNMKEETECGIWGFRFLHTFNVGPFRGLILTPFACQICYRIMATTHTHLTLLYFDSSLYLNKICAK